MTHPHVVLLLHGIRTQGEWMNRVASILESQDNVSAAKQIRYEFFDIFRFLSPFSSHKNKPIERVARLIAEEKATNKNVKISIIAHSFGTYIIGKILLDNPRVHIHRLILCGSVLPDNFDWDRLKDDQLSRSTDDRNFRVINDCGLKDKWPVFAKLVSKDYGSSGRFGFGHTWVRDRYFSGGHSEFFSEEFVRKFWLPYIIEGEIIEGIIERLKEPWWLSALTIIRPPYILLMVFFLFLFLAPIEKSIECRKRDDVWLCVQHQFMPPAVLGPALLRASQGNGYIKLYWNLELESDALVKYWQLRSRETDTSTWSNWADLDVEFSDGYSAKLDKLAIGNEYHVQIRALNFGIAGVPSNLIIVRVVRKPTAPMLTATPTNEAIELSWQPGPNSGGIQRNWKYRLMEEGTDEWSTWRSIPSDSRRNSHTVWNLQNGVKYRVQLVESNELGEGETSEIHEVRPLEPPDPPNVHVIGRDEEALLTWSVGSPRTGQISELQFRYMEIKERSWSHWFTLPDVSGEAGYVIRGLSNGSTYMIEVRRVNDVGPGDASQQVEVRPLGRPRAPELMTVEREDGVILVWKEGPNGGVSVDEWQYRFAPASSKDWSEWRDLVDVGGESSYEIYGLERGQRYKFQLRAVNHIGVGAPSDVKISKIGESGSRKDVSLEVREDRQVEGERKFQLTHGRSYTCALEESGKVICWGVE